MNRALRNALLCTAGLLLAGAAPAQDADLCGIDTHVGADGTVELSNTGNTTKCDTPTGKSPAAPAGASANPPLQPAPAAATAAVVPPAAPTPAPGEAGNTSTASSADSATDQAQPGSDPRQQYRDAMLRGAPGTTAANPAVSRRYKMISKDAYQSAVQNAGVPASTPESDAGAAPSP